MKGGVVEGGGGEKDYQLPENHCLEERVGRAESLERSVAVTDMDSRRARRRYGCGKEQGGGGAAMESSSISGSVYQRRGSLTW